MQDQEAAAAEEKAAAEIDEETGEIKPPEGVEAAEIELPEPGAIVVQDANDVYRRMELEDERQIMEELQGRALETMLYSFQIDGKRATGFSWVGARESVRTLNARGYTRIRMDSTVPPKIEEFENEEGERAYRVTVYALDEKSGGGNWGISAQPMKMS